MWMSETANAMNLERLRFYNEDGGDVFDKIWDPLLFSGCRLLCCFYCLTVYILFFTRARALTVRLLGLLGCIIIRARALTHWTQEVSQTSSNLHDIYCLFSPQHDVQGTGERALRWHHSRMCGARACLSLLAALIIFYLSLDFSLCSLCIYSLCVYLCIYVLYMGL